MGRSSGSERLFPMKKPAQHLIAEVPRRQARVEITIGIDLGDVWSHYCTLNQGGEVVDRGRFRTIPKAVEKWFTDVPPARITMEAGTHSIWISEQLRSLGTRNHCLRRDKADALQYKCAVLIVQ
jgi:transposase